MTDWKMIDAGGDAKGAVLPDMNLEAVRGVLGSTARVTEWSSVHAMARNAGRDEGGDWGGVSVPVLCERIDAGVPAPEYLPMLDKARETLESVGESACGEFAITKRRRTAIRDEGDEVDVDRMLEGRADCWRTSIRGRAGRVFRLGWEHGHSAAATDKFFAEVGATVGVLADALTVRGYSLEVVGLVSSSSPWCLGRKGDAPCATVEAVTILRAGSPFDAAAIGAWAERAFARRVVFSRQAGSVVHGTPGLSAALGLDWLVGPNGPDPKASAAVAVRKFLELISNRASALAPAGGINP